MKTRWLQLMGAAVLAAGWVVAQDSPQAPNASREQRLERLLQKRGIQLTEEQRQQLLERWRARRGDAGQKPEGTAFGPGRGRGRFGGVGVGKRLRGLREEVVKFYDRDGDGQLSEEERAALREDLKARRERLLQKYDQDKDGTLSEVERGQLRNDLREFLKDAMATYDANGDGELSREERAHAFRELWASKAFLEQ